MTNTFKEYVKSEMRYLKDINGSIIDTCTDKIYKNKAEWLKDNFNISEEDLSK